MAHKGHPIPPPPVLPAGIPPPPHPNTLPLQGVQAGGMAQQPQRPQGNQHMAQPIPQQQMGQHPMHQTTGQQQQGIHGGFQNGLGPQQLQNQYQQPQMGMGVGLSGAQNYGGSQQFRGAGRSLSLPTGPVFKAFEFSKPTHRDVESGEKPSWLMVTSADKLDISSADIERRIKTKRASSKKSALDEYNRLPSADMRYLIKKLIDDLNFKEPNQLKEWNFHLIETDKREYVMGRSRVRDIGTMRVYLKQSTKAEARESARINLQRSTALGGSVDLSNTHMTNGFVQNAGFGVQGNGMGMHGMQSNNLAPHTGFQGGPGQGQGMLGIQQPFNNGLQTNSGMHTGVMPGQAGAGVHLPGGQGLMNGGAFAAASKPGKLNTPGGNNSNGMPAATNIKVVTNNKSPDKKNKCSSKDRNNKRSKSRHGSRGRSHPRDSTSSGSDSDSDSDDTSSDSEIGERVDNMEKKMRRLSKNFEKININRRASTSSHLPRAPMPPERRGSFRHSQPVQHRATPQRRRPSPIDIPRRSPKMIERVYLSSDSGRDYSDGYASSGSRNSWVERGSAFSRPDSDLTPMSSYGSLNGPLNNPFATYREHRKPGARGFGSSSMSPGGSDYDYDHDYDRRRGRRHSDKYLPNSHTEYFPVPGARTGKYDYRRQAEEYDDRNKARKQREQRDKYMRDERYRQSSRAY